MKSIKEIIIDELPAKRIEATTLYNSVKRGVKASIEPWQFAQNNPELSGNALDEAYNKEVESRTENIMTVILNEIYL
jgi:hypothetical protein